MAWFSVSEWSSKISQMATSVFSYFPELKEPICGAEPIITNMGTQTVTNSLLKEAAEKAAEIAKECPCGDFICDMTKDFTKKTYYLDDLKNYLASKLPVGQILPGSLSEGICSIEKTFGVSKYIAGPVALAALVAGGIGLVYLYKKYNVKTPKDLIIELLKKYLPLLAKSDILNLGDAVEGAIDKAVEEAFKQYNLKWPDAKMSPNDEAEFKQKIRTHKMDQLGIKLGTYGQRLNDALVQSKPASDVKVPGMKSAPLTKEGAGLLKNAVYDILYSPQVITVDSRFNMQ